MNGKFYLVVVKGKKRVSDLYRPPFEKEEENNLYNNRKNLI